MMYTSFYQRTDAKQGKREGIVLLIVIAMLTLFAVVGLAFVFYAEAEAVSTSVTVQGQSKTLPDADPELLLSYFLSQLLYDTANNNSALRGHSLARTMYGYNQYGLSASAYSGIGRIHKTYGAGDPAALNGSDDYYLPNYQYYPGDNFIRYPEYYGYQMTAPPAPPPPPANASYRAGNAPYTYPDMNSMFLARVDADGSVIAPSFHRQYLSPLNKYSVLFPSVSYHTNYSPADTDPTYLNVRNLDFAKGFKYTDAKGNVTYYNNDSCWLDLGWPVMIAPNGKKYKAMFAPLIIDLDNRVNMWVTGNQRSTGSTGGTHVSNKGYGASEINLSSIVTAPAELNQLVNVMRYKNAGLSPYLPPAQWPQRDGLIYSRIDFDGYNGGALPLPMNPANKSNPGYFIWPDYPNGTYAPPGTPPWFSPIVGLGTVPNELLTHPLGYNIFNPGANNPPPSASTMEAILRYLGTGAPAATSGLFKSMPQTFANSANRSLLTSHSWNLDRITGAPYIPFYPYAASNWSYKAANWSASNPFPVITNSANPLQALSSPNYANAAPANSEFTVDYRSALVNRLRVNLNRISSSQYDYPALNPNNPGTITNTAQFTAAQTARQNLAKSIYHVLILVTGAQDPLTANNAGAPMTVGSPSYLAAQWLAQFAVNIVDYMDNDDFITPFNWDTTNPVTGWVYGTETPRLVANEAYAEIDNDPNDPSLVNGNWVAAPTVYNLNAWVELHNPFKNTGATGTNEAYPYDGGLVRLNLGANPNAAYQIILSPNDANLRSSTNARGDPALQMKTVAQPNPQAQQQFANVWGVTAPTSQVVPANGAFSDPAQVNNGFFVAGPQIGFIQNTSPNLPSTWNSTQLTAPFNVVAGTNPKANDPLTLNSVITNGTTILIRRLACPYLAFNNDPTGNTGIYNPFVTIDYIQNLKTYDNRVAATDANGVLTMNANNNPFGNAAWGRSQPYAAFSLAVQAPVPASVNQPQNTFYRHNANDPTTPGNSLATFTTPFDWLVHLDRPVVNSLELLHVSGYRPHELTQQFVTNAGKFQHYAPWQNPNALIYRALELLGVPNYLNGTSMGGRVPGKININTLNALQVWLALCDPQNNPQNNFSTGLTSAQAQALFTSVIQSRTPGAAPGQNDVPFRPFSSGFVANTSTTAPDAQYQYGSGIDDTLLRTTAVTPNQNPLSATQANPPFGNLLFNVGVAGNHPYQRLELLQKIFNNTTTTSNVFAVWLTVGFFEVDDTFTPPKIGSEIGRDQGRQIRHRMFSIVDRSQLTLFSTTAAQFTVNATRGAATTVPVAATSGTLANGTNWSIQPGMLLEIGSPGNSEVVVVQAVGANNFTAVFSGNYPVGGGSPPTWVAQTPVVCRGNPGPQPNYNPRSDPLVVPHFTIIK